MTDSDPMPGAKPGDPTKLTPASKDAPTLAPGSKATAEGLASLLAKSKLLSEQQEVAFRQWTTESTDDRALAKKLVAEGWLTSWQAERLLSGYGVFHLGKYLLLEKLGEGGMGEVYKARQGVTGRIVALKVMSPQRFDDPDSVARFRQEVRAAAALHHPNIVTTFDADCAGRNHFLVMEYVDGRDLSSWIDEHGRLPYAWAAECIRQGALGLQHAHEKGLVHRDLKPANLMVIGNSLDESPEVKILDLGLARMDGAKGLDLTTTCEVFGTPHYMSPEQAKSARSADIRSDIFSLGATLFKLLTGEIPYEGRMLSEQMAARFAGPPREVRDFAPEVPAELGEIVGKCMRPSAEDRFQTPAELVRAIERFLARDKAGIVLSEEAQPRSAVVGPAVAPASAEPSSAKAWPLLAAAGGVLVVAIVAWWATRPSQSVVAKQSETSGTSAKADPPKTEPKSKKTETPTTVKKGGSENPVATSGVAEMLLSTDYEWSEPKNLGPEINRGKRNLNASVSADELLLVYSRDQKLWTSRRASTSEPFGKPELLPETINDKVGEATSISGDGLLLAISSTRAGSAADDIYLASRKTRDESFAAPVRLPLPVNTTTGERVPLLSSDGLTLIVTTVRQPALGGGHLVRYTRNSRDEPFDHEMVFPPPISSPVYNTADWLSADGRAILTTRMGKPPFETRLYVRPSSAAEFGPEHLLGGPFDKFNPGRPWLSPDGKRMYFHSREFAPRHGDLDLWFSERKKRA